MATSSHKRALSSGEAPTTKRANTQFQPGAARYVYITMSTTKIVHEYANDAVEEVRKYHHAYQTQDDAENALKEMANDWYPSVEWCVNKRPTGLQLYTDDEDDVEDDVELKVERLMLMPAGCTPKVKLLKLADPDDPDNSSSDDKDDDEEGESTDEEDYEDYYDHDSEADEDDEVEVVTVDGTKK